MYPTIHYTNIIFFIACDSNSTKSNSVDKDSSKQIKVLDTPSKVQLPDSARNSSTILYVWLVDFDHKTKRRNPKFKSEYLNIDSLIKGPNEMEPNIRLDKIKISGDTLYTEIKDSEYFGERIGSYGANSYIADVVINLTSIKNINFVKIDFQDGSHISPGIWGKKDYKNYKEVR